MYQEDRFLLLDLRRAALGDITQNCPLLARRVQRAKFRGELIQPRPPGHRCVGRIAAAASLFATGDLNYARKYL